MGATTKSIEVNRPYGEVVAAVESIPGVMELVRAFGRAEFLSAHDDGSEEWNVFIVLGTMYVGGRVVVQSPARGELTWHSVSGIENMTGLAAIPYSDGALVTASVEFEVDGVLTGPLTGWLLRGIVGRYVDALLERLRHHIEYGE